jgi:predicted amidophosphoribosyltransferase
MNLLEDLSDWIFPRICFHCGERLEPGLTALCTLCRFYGYPQSEPIGGILPEPFSFLQPLWVFEKGGSLRKLIHALKYGGVPQIGVELGECMGLQLLPGLLRQFELEPEQIFLIPVPLHPKKERQRGYNQARVLSMGIQNILPVRLAPDGWVIRRKWTRSQTGLSPDKRASNLNEAFGVEDSVKVLANPLIGIKAIIVVDDVYTTGATLFSLMREVRLAVEKNIGSGELPEESSLIFGGITLAAGG